MKPRAASSKSCAVAERQRVEEGVVVRAGLRRGVLAALIVGRHVVGCLLLAAHLGAAGGLAVEAWSSPMVTVTLLILPVKALGAA